MLLLAENGWPDFYLVQGCETGVVSQYLSGNVPSLGSGLVTAGLLVGLQLLLVAGVLVALVRRGQARYGLKPSWARFLDGAICVGFFLAWEAALRTSALATPEVFVPDPLTFWKANPRLLTQAHAARIGLVGLEHRQRVAGIFDKDHLGPKPPGVYRIAFMGDSQVISSGRFLYAGPLTYPKRLEATLDLQGLSGPRGQAVEVLNAGVSGFSSWQGLMLLRSDLLPLEPDVVVAAFGYHDANSAISSDREVLTDNPWTWRVRTLMYSSRLCLLLRSLILHAEESWEDRTGPDHSTVRVPLAHYVENLEDLAEQGRRHSFRLVLLAEPFGTEEAAECCAEYRQAMVRVAAERGLPYIDGQAFFAQLPPDQRKACFQDDIHLTREGHARMAGLVLERLVEFGLLARRQEGGTVAPSEVRR